MATSNKGTKQQGAASADSNTTVRDRKDGVGNRSASESLAERCQRIQQRADAAEARRADLLQIATHDLRNPLGVILVTTTMLAREAASPQQARQIAAIRRSAGEMNQIIEDLVDASSIDAGGLLLGQDVYDAAEIVQEAFAAATASASDKSITVEANIADGLPLLYVDRSRLLQVFSRIVGNALRFMPKTGSLTIGAERIGQAVRFYVTDSGPGVPESQRPFVFSRRPPPERRTCRGTGLGMFVAKGIVEAHGGHIEMTTDVARGSTVSFTLPAMSGDRTEV
ncbi:MAG: HAMP domain-containing histidine kinase [Polyangiaceae bacterium]|nr:HAMP domain-containing histidine kinase [Polyangiaceae bacterium]